MNNRIPEEDKRVKVSISIDPHLNRKLQKIAIDKKIYKKSRLLENIIKKYIEENGY